MFDFLKKKIGGFIDSLAKREEEKAPEPEAPGPEMPEPAAAQETVEKQEPVPEKEQAGRGPEQKPVPQQPPAPVPQPARALQQAAAPPKDEAHAKAVGKPQPEKQEVRSGPERTGQEQAPAPAPGQKEKPRIRLGAISAIKSFVTSEVEITEDDVKPLLENFELELLEADVDISVAEAIRASLKERLVGARAPKSGLHPFVGSAIRGALEEVMANGRAFDLVERVAACSKPAKIMFIGINGAGKTTTMAKAASLLMGAGMKVVFAAADTFRAAAIEQMAVHADRLGVKMIKRDYGSDPTSVAYDAVNYAKAHGIDAVLIDTAGRQDTNISLLNEMKKMSRVIRPDLKIYVGESIAGNAIIEQISSFNREIGIDAVILTKLDCDPKGGTMLSINKATGIPIIYVGTGQGYGDLEKFDAAKIAARIVG